ncbi:latent-transforming growth factor beta-binding protein 4-like [Moschus berezovskii]|uniref:latent-transforming growth factor beta-binding protein 4-like n=1 Tax=Moschus berezovskii TaxID=68408 RepID=UPI002443905B|nr:latent-transforming growth factor beta-binding protein 4-like [Moschus berezovskii]
MPQGSAPWRHRALIGGKFAARDWDCGENESASGGGGRRGSAEPDPLDRRAAWSATPRRTRCGCLAPAAAAPSCCPSQAVEVAAIPGRPAGVPACRCCPSRSPRRSRCFRASCRVRSCRPEKCAGPQRCLAPGPPELPSPSPSVRKRQVSLNWQPLTLQEARALLRRRRPRGPGARALLRRRPPQRAPAGQSRAAA